MEICSSTFFSCHISTDLVSLTYFINYDDAGDFPGNDNHCFFLHPGFLVFPLCHMNTFCFMTGNIWVNSVKSHLLSIPCSISVKKKTLNDILLMLLPASILELARHYNLQILSTGQYLLEKSGYIHTSIYIYIYLKHTSSNLMFCKVHEYSN